MPIPLVIHFGKDEVALGSVYAYGPQAAFAIKLPVRPDRVELDPDAWVLSDKTSSRAGN